MPINRNVLMFVIGLLVAIVAVLGYKQYQDSKQPDGVQINIGKDGLKIQNK
jgi:predicted negative regulator of RcsB-dependent stress response